MDKDYDFEVHQIANTKTERDIFYSEHKNHGAKAISDDNVHWRYQITENLIFDWEKFAHLIKPLIEPAEYKHLILPHLSEPTNLKEQRFCYADSLKEFLKIDFKVWLHIMKTSFQCSEKYSFPLKNNQEKAWKDCFKILQEVLPTFDNRYPNFNIIFEYVLPYRGGKRPDVLLINNDYVLVLEFKMKKWYSQVDIDQVDSYARDIQEYHFESRDKKVIPFFVCTDDEANYLEEKDNITICSKDHLGEALIQQVNGLTRWINSKYEPLPSIIDSAKKIMQKEGLPNIRRASSAGLPQALKCLNNIALKAQKEKRHIAIFVTGVPGSGKTYLGLQYVYDIDNVRDSNQQDALYISGNQALLTVLSQILNNKAFIKRVSDLRKEHWKINSNSSLQL